MIDRRNAWAAVLILMAGILLPVAGVYAAASRAVITSGPASAATFAADINEELVALYNSTATAVTGVGGTANAITGSVTPAVTAYAAGQIYGITVTADSTSSVTLNLNSVGTRAVVDSNGTALSATHYLVNGRRYFLHDNGTHLRVMNDGELGRLREIYIPANQMWADGASACASGTATGTNEITLPVWDCDGAGSLQEGVQFIVQAPKRTAETTLTAAVDWTAVSGSGNVIWLVGCLARSNDDALDTAFGTTQSSTDTLLTAGDEHISPTTSAITPAGTWAEGDVLICHLERDGDAAGDTLNNVDARIIGARIFLTDTYNADN